MPLPFNANTPQPNDTISSTQDPIQKNFSSIDTAFNEVTDKFVKYAFQNVSTIAAPIPPIGILHTVLGTQSLAGEGVPFMRLASGDYQMLPDVYSANIVPGQTVFGFVFGAVRFNWGIFNLNAASIPVSLKVAFLTTNYAVSITPSTGSGITTPGIITYQAGLNTITFHKPSTMANAICSFIAIGL